MEKEKIINEIKNVQPIKGHNSMGASESWYNAYYMLSKCFVMEELEKMSKKELQNLVKLAEFAGEVFY